MAYARFDDRYDDHRKVKRALRREPAAVAIHSMAITYCNRHETDGLVDAMQVEDWIAVLPYKPAQKARVLSTLLELRLFDEVDAEHFAVHDFLDWNDSRAHRQRLRDAGRKGAQMRWAKGGADATPNADRNADRIGGARSGANGPPHQHHTTPTPETSSEVSSPEFSDDVIRLCDLQSRLARERTGESPRSRKLLPTTAWHKEMDRLIRLDDRSPEEIERAIWWVHQHHFWGKTVLAVDKLRAQFPKLEAEARAKRGAPATSSTVDDKLEQLRREAAGGDFIEGRGAA